MNCLPQLQYWHKYLTGCALALAVLAATAGAQIANLADGPIALAASLTGIVIDGDLSDWPEDIPRVPLRNEFGAYGRTDLEGVDLSTSDDFDPAMMVGYDDVKDLLYVAVIVRDDELYMDGDPIHRDGIEIYLSDLSPGSRPLQHRIATSRHGQDNPQQGDVRSAWRNEGDHLVYEWQGSIADGRRRRVLDEGGIFGFDVVAVDNDGDGHTAWVPWGPPVSGKMSSDDRVGRVLLAPTDMSAADTASLTAILAAFTDGRGTGFEQLQNLERHEAAVERLIEQLVESNVGVAGSQAAAMAARIAGQIAAAAAREGAVAAAGARMLEPVPLAPAVVHVPSAHLMAELDDEGLSSVAHQAVNIAGACALILVIGFTVVMVRRSGRGPRQDSHAVTAMDERMAQIEARMTDTQDVMIALSEKLDRIDDRKSEG